MLDHAKVEAKLFMNDEVKGRDRDVGAQDGVVTLSGTLTSEAQDQGALAIARQMQRRSSPRQAVGRTGLAVAA